MVQLVRKVVARPESTKRKIILKARLAGVKIKMGAALSFDVIFEIKLFTG